MSNINRMVFQSISESEKTLFNNFLNALIEYNSISENDYNDIHIYQEDCVFILEWVQVPFGNEWGGKFEFVDDDEFITKQVNFPDGSYDYAFSDDEKEIMISNWLEEHPNWKKTPYAGWYEESNIESFEEGTQDENHESAEAGNAVGEN